MFEGQNLLMILKKNEIKIFCHVQYLCFGHGLSHMLLLAISNLVGNKIFVYPIFNVNIYLNDHCTYSTFQLFCRDISCFISENKKKCFLLRFKGNFLIWPLTPNSFKHPYNVVEIDFLGWEFFLTILTTYRFDWNQFWADRTEPEVAHFIGAKKKVPIKIVWFQWFFMFSIHFLSRLHFSSFNFKAFNTTEIYQEMSRQKNGTYLSIFGFF